MAKKAIIIGASSGIGAALASILSNHGYELGLAARRTSMLEELCASLPGPAQIATIDVTQTSNATSSLEQLIQKMGDVELFILSAGSGSVNKNLDLQPELDTIAVNVSGFATMANSAARHLQQRGSGTLVGLSPIAAIRGHGDAPAYGASKAFASNYLQGLRQKFARLGLPVTVLDIQPGFVDTDMAKSDNLFWVAPPRKAAMQIYRAIKKKRSHAYISRR